MIKQLTLIKMLCEILDNKTKAINYLWNLNLKYVN